MTASELFQIVIDFENYYLDSDLSRGVHYGCDCGCGGEHYKDKPELWDNMVRDHNESYEAFQELCKHLNIKWDY